MDMVKLKSQNWNIRYSIDLPLQKQLKIANNTKQKKKRSPDQAFHHMNNQIQLQETEERPHHFTIRQIKA